MAQGYAASLIKGLGALGWREGENLRLDWRWTGGDPAPFDRYAAELVTLDPSVLLAQSSPSVLALRRKTSSDPDRVYDGHRSRSDKDLWRTSRIPAATSPASAIINALMAGKWLEMLTQVTPPVAHVAVLYNPVTAPYAGLMMSAIEDAAPSFTSRRRAAPCHDDAEIEVDDGGACARQARRIAAC